MAHVPLYKDRGTVEQIGYYIEDLFKLFGVDLRAGIELYEFQLENPDCGKNGSKSAKERKSKMSAAKEEENAMKLERLAEM